MRSLGMENLYAPKEGGVVSLEECTVNQEPVPPQCPGKERLEVHVEEAAHPEAFSSQRRGRDKGNTDSDEERNLLDGLPNNVTHGYAEFCSGKDREFEQDNGPEEPPFKMRRGSPPSRSKEYDRADDVSKFLTFTKEGSGGFHSSQTVHDLYHQHVMVEV